MSNTTITLTMVYRMSDEIIHVASATNTIPTESMRSFNELVASDPMVCYMINGKIIQQGLFTRTELEPYL